MNKHYSFRIGDIFILKYKGVKIKFFVAPALVHSYKDLMIGDIDEKTPVYFTQLVHNPFNKGIRDELDRMTGYENEIWTPFEALFDGYWLERFWSTLHKYIKNGDVTDFRIYPFSDRTVKYNVNREYKIYNNRAPYKTRNGSVYNKASRYTPEVLKDIVKCKNAADLIAVIKGAVFTELPLYQLVSVYDLVQSICNNCASEAKDVYYKSLLNKLKQMVGCITTAPPGTY